MGKDQVMALVLKDEELLYEIEMDGKAGDKGDAQEEEYSPYLVLNTEPAPPHWRRFVHSTSM
jgi:hypothetical protein